jgi:endonuclease YncB( thermonuclease family)
MEQFFAKAAVLALAIFAMATLPSALAQESNNSPTCPDVANFPNTGIVSRVVDSWTVELTDGRQLYPSNIIVPVIGPDGPVVGEGWARASADYMGPLLNGESVRWFQTSRKPDRYGRLEALIGLPDNRLVQGHLLEAGFAMFEGLVRSLPCARTLITSEQLAQVNRMGLWSESSPRFSSATTKLAPATGYWVSIRAKVISVGIRPKRHYLNFGRKWREDFTVELSPSATKRIFGSDEALTELKGRWITVRGRLQQKGGPMIVVSSRNQIETSYP